MNIKVLIDFDIFVETKKDNKNVKFLKKIVEMYSCDLFVAKKDLPLFNSLSLYNVNLFIEEELENKDLFISEVSKKYDWILYFKKNIFKVECTENIVYTPIDLRGDLKQFDNISFTEHAKNKKYYHDFSNYYMYTLANDTEKEAKFLISIFKKYLNKDSGKVLDCCCGVGRHSYILAQNSFEVTGVDFSEDQISNAKRIHAHPSIDYKNMDVRNLCLADKDYDMSCCMWTTYNYLSLDSDLKKFIYSNYCHQKKGGILVLDSKNIPRLEPHRLYNRYTEKANFKMEIMINKYVYNNIQNSQYFLFINDSGEKKFFFDDEFVRFYTIEELNKIIDGYYEIIDVYGDFDMNEYDEKTSNRFITILRRI